MTRLRAWCRQLWLSGPVIVRRRHTYLADLRRAYQTGLDRGRQ